MVGSRFGPAVAPGGGLRGRPNVFAASLLGPFGCGERVGVLGSWKEVVAMSLEQGHSPWGLMR